MSNTSNTDGPVSDITGRKFRRNAAHFKKLHCTARPDGTGELVKGRIFQGPSGQYKHITANPDGSITVGAKAFVDDAIAFFSAAISSNPTIDDGIKQHLIAFVDAMDARAVAKHGYSGSAEDAAINWNATTPEE